ncbi:MAG: transcriptional repressor [Verrucomicrobiota bacterium]|nr:transcriptional repressor [Verrucomicrobiota bacterium]
MARSSHPSHAELLESALQTLRDHAHRITTPRRAILQVLTSEHGPFTAEQLHSRIEEGVCDLVTVYRCLAAMEEINIVRRCDFGDGSYRYEINTGENHHHHLICRGCHSVKTIDFCVAASLERFARRMGYSNVNHTLEIFGVCQQCQRARAS